MPHSRRAARLLRVHTGGNAPCVTARRRSPSQKSLAKRLASRPGPRVDCACRGCDAVKPRLAREPEQRAAIGAAAVRGRPGSPMLNTRASPAAATRRSSSLTPLARRASAGRTPFPYKPVLTLDGQAAEEVMNSHEHRPRSALCQVHRSAGRLPSSLFGWRAKPMCFRCSVGARGRHFIRATVFIWARTRESVLSHQHLHSLSVYGFQYPICDTPLAGAEPPGYHGDQTPLPGDTSRGRRMRLRPEELFALERRDVDRKAGEDAARA
jgi:hypothetical protein